MIKTLVTLALSLTLVACASNSKKEEAPAANQTQAKPVGPGDIASEGHKAFLNAPGLTEAQKIKLSDIMKTTYAEATKVKNEIGKQKLDLFKMITSPSAKKKDIEAMKRKIVTLDKKRLDLMLKSMDDVSSIIGRNPETADYLQKIMHEHMRAGEGF